MTTLTLGTHKGIGVLSVLFTRVREGMWTAAKRRAERRALCDLLELEDHRLFDIGLDRADIEGLRHQPVQPAGAALARLRAKTAAV